jgi:predicted nuclease of restriction endonuclease-like RecB superfamily
LVSLTKLKMSVRKGRAYPKFADEELAAALEESRNRYEESIGTKLGEFDGDEILSLFPDRKTGETAASVMGRFYSFRTRRIEELLTEEEYMRLQRNGIETSMDVRLRLFQYLSERHSGFMSSESREELLSDFGEEISLPAERLEESLWLDDDDDKVLVRLVDEPPADLAAAYDMEIFSTILMNSYSLTLGPVRDGAVVKFIFRGLRLYGLLFEARSSEEGLEFTVEGPLTLFRKPSKFGFRLAILLYRLRQLASRKPFSCRYAIEFRKSRKKATLEGDISEIPPLSWPNVGDLRFSLFDSKVEAKVYSTFSTIDLNGWRVEREPEPIILGSSVFIPDFRLRRGDAEVLLEVVGFWMPEYKKRKGAKLKGLQKAGLKEMLLLVDKKAEKDFSSITNYPIFTYARKGSSYRIPYARILGYLEEKYPWERPTDRREGDGRATIVEHDEGRYRVFW